MRKIEIISVPVTDQQKAKEFYLKVGFQVIVEAPMDATQLWVQLGFPGAETSITLVTWFKDMKPGCLDGLVISSKDIASDIKDFSSKGIKMSEIQNTPWGKFSHFADPDGNSWMLHEQTSNI